MSDVGATNISRGTHTPTTGATEISVSTSEIIYGWQMRQFFGGVDPWMPFENKWWTGAFLDMTEISSIVFSCAPGITSGAIISEIDPYGTGNENVGRITIPIIGNLLGSTEYTWSLSMTIEHGTYDEGVVSRSYNTTTQITGFDGDVADPMTFTTEAAAPTKATNPTPTDTDTEVDFSDYTVSWDDGGGADSYNVYFGDSDTPVSLGNQAETTKVIPYTTEVDEDDVTHAYVGGTEINWNVPLYWRIDAVNDVGTTEGDVWSFDPRAAKVTNPGPTDADTDIELYPEYDWDASTVATSYDLYVGIGELMGDIAIDVLGLEATSYDSAVVDFQNGNIWGYNSTYYWRVDSVNEFGTVEGDEWTFDSILFAPPLPSGMSLTDVEGEEGELTGTPSGENAISTVRRLLVAAANKIFYEDE